MTNINKDIYIIKNRFFVDFSSLSLFFFFSYFFKFKVNICNITILKIVFIIEDDSTSTVIINISIM